MAGVVGCGIFELYQKCRILVRGCNNVRKWCWSGVLKMRSRLTGTALGIWTFSDSEVCASRVREIDAVIEYPVEREIHYDGSNVPVGSEYQLSIIVGPVRRGIDIGQISLIRRRSRYVVVVSVQVDSIGPEFFDGQTALKYCSAIDPQSFFDSQILKDDRGAKLMAPVADYIEPDFNLSGYSLRLPSTIQLFRGCLEGRAPRVEQELAESVYPGLSQQVEKIVPLPVVERGPGDERVASRRGTNVIGATWKELEMSGPDTVWARHSGDLSNIRRV